MTEEQIPEGFRVVKIKPETPPWEVERQGKTDELISGARAAIIEWLNNSAKVLYWHGDGEGSISESPIIAPIIEHLNQTYPEQSRRILENRYLGAMDISIVEAPGLALILTMGRGSSGKQVF